MTDEQWQRKRIDELEIGLLDCIDVVFTSGDSDECVPCNLKCRDRTDCEQCAYLEALDNSYDWGDTDDVLPPQCSNCGLIDALTPLKSDPRERLCRYCDLWSRRPLDNGDGDDQGLERLIAHWRSDDRARAAE